MLTTTTKQIREREPGSARWSKVEEKVVILNCVVKAVSGVIWL